MADRIDLRRRLQEVAFRQRGYFTAHQAKDLGYSYQAQKYHADRGNWMRIDRGLFRIAGWPSAAEDSYTRWSVWSGGRGVISHQSAAEVHGMGEIDPSHIHITMPSDFSTRNSLVVVHTATLNAVDVEDRGDFSVTTSTRTVLDLAASSGVTQEQLDSVVEDAQGDGLLDRSELRRRMDAFGDFAALRLERSLTLHSELSQ